VSDPIQLQLVNTALVVWARAWLQDAGPQWQVFDLDAPADVEIRYPHLVCLASASSTSGPPLRDPDADLSFTVQWDAVGKRRDQTQLAADRINRLMLGRGPDGSLSHPLDPHLPANYREQGRILADGAGAPVPTPPAAPGSTRLYSVPQRYTVFLTQL
jgi:hypothetical protein